MNGMLFVKLKEALFSVLPVTLIVILLNFTPLVNVSLTEIIVFSISALFLTLGIGLFTLGADIAMTPMGEQIGSGLTKTRNLKILLLVCFALGFLITVAEPDLSILAEQVGSNSLILFVGIGVGVFLLISVLKIIFKRQLATILMYLSRFYFQLLLFPRIIKH
jgi:hypothetical protein